ncbi:subtilisin-like protein [Aulographum hederae CBS 113979]|uniref:tripeptidyl-peptidase II n=1 Tax=Aulographum hederae CBS 113979 TaxID=1176131 RepID=A0A6G1HB75_9PEZI|nr:subtilisin-like protein [Aulographum hederae CBS 113979]
MAMSICVKALVCASLLFSNAASASPTAIQARSPYAVKDTHRVPARWQNVGEPAREHTIRLSIFLKQERFEELENHLLKSSDPDHHMYGHHLSQKEVDDYIKPSNQALNYVHEWLQSNGVDSDRLSYTSAKDAIKVDLPVSHVEHLLDTKYSIYEHIEDGSRLVRTPEYSLPGHLHKHINVITPTNQFLRNNPRGSHVRIVEDSPAGGSKWPGYTQPPEPSDPVVAAACNFSRVTPTCLRTIYGTLNYTVQSAGKNQVGLTDYLGEVNIRSDAKKFLELFRPEAVSGAASFKQISINGGTLAQVLNETLLENETGIEGNLDAQNILGISWPTPLTAYSTGGLNPSYIPDNYTDTNSDEPYVAWAQYVLGTKDIPQVISTSYGDDEQTVTYAYAKQTCDLFAQFGARGVTLLFSSGDEGVGPTGYCNSNDGKGTYQFLPSFPNDCQWVTGVGATAYYPEVAAYDPRFSIPFTSGAGFSNYFPAPKWQKSVVNKYIKSLNGQYDGLYNKTGRAYPDLSALGQIYATVWNGSVYGVDGTSASSPTTAGVLTLVNDALIAAGRPTLGFMNPWLYKKGYKAFTDVVEGNSAGCNTTGFPAQKGWDAVTGWGTPYFPDILAVLGLSEKGHGHGHGN